jgi:hypothetical protein
MGSDMKQDSDESTALLQRAAGGENIPNQVGCIGQVKLDKRSCESSSFRAQLSACPRASQQKIREKLGIGTDDEDIGVESDETGAVDLPDDMIQRLRVDLSFWKPN